jgi:hypothetical protein
LSKKTEVRGGEYLMTLYVKQIKYMKNNFYFQHDYHSREDGKLLEIKMKHGMSGVGTYWCLVEMLHEGGGYIETKQNLLAFQLQVDEQIITDIVERCFSVEDDKITSNRVKLNLFEREQKKIHNQEKGKRGAEVRWNKTKPDPNKGIVEVINNHSTTIVELYPDYSSTIVNDAKGKGKEKEKEKDKVKSKLIEIFKYEIQDKLLTEEQVLSINFNKLKTDLNLFFNETYPTWEQDLKRTDPNMFCIGLEKKFKFDNFRIATIKAYKLLNK